MMSLQRHIEVLVGFAYSRKLASILQARQLRLCVLPAVTSASPDFPCTLADWETTMALFIERHGLSPHKDGVLEDARAMAEYLGGNTLRVHAECRLVVTLMERQGPAAVSYIGVSKLSCRACAAWLSSLQSVYGIRFSTKGCHGKWYPGWDLPQIPTRSQDDLENVLKLNSLFKSKIEGAYLDYVQRQGRGLGG